MKANELMIGDWVFNKFLNKNIKITPYDFFSKYPKVIEGNDLEPIPLTEEIIEKNGFEYDDTNIGWRLGTHDFMIELGHIPFEEDEDYLFVWVADKRARLDYVHELQHALRLCGIEKETQL